ncbi:MAG TPA: DUF2071 domain-containing protein [Ohtaekwangia sp.]|nr:DUF2071 domain-containing protein [Ohtaekwangia sp.]
MRLLKRLPIHYKGELHDVRLINFSIAMEEVLNKISPNIKARDFNGRAMISMVDVKLKNMYAVKIPFVHFNYRHVAFRLLVDDSQYNNGAHKGIFFFRSFTDKPLIVFGGKLMTDYNLELANIEETSSEVTISQGDKKVKYCLDNRTAAANPDLKSRIGALDRAYAVLGNTVRVTQIQREKWPIELVSCNRFENTFFKTAKFEGAFRVPETIYYDWFPPKAIHV